MKPDEEVKPIYAAFAGPPLPLAQSLCAALHDLPAQRRAQCCSGHPGTAMTGECINIVSAALRSGAVTLDAAAVTACVDAETQALQGCGWVTQGQPALPAACTGLFHGTIATNGVCRSALECADGQTCLGSGPTAAGHCGAPKGNGQACLISIDPLASYTRDYDDPRHPECAGFCGHRHCEKKFILGTKCFLARQCGSGSHCDGQSCVAGDLAKAGESCVVDACAQGLRCIAGKCAAPKEAGAACKQDFECLASCLPKTGVCGMRCDL